MISLKSQEKELMEKFIQLSTKNQVNYFVLNIIKDQIRAIKLIAREKIKRIDRFINEVNALKTLVKFISLIKLQDHPNVIKLFEIYEDKTNVYLVQE